MASVEPVGTAGLRIELEEVEAALLVSLAQQLVDLVRADDADDADPLVAIVGIDPGARTPDDPALRRLLPDAYADDDEAAARFRQFTERDLRARKVADAARVLQMLDRAPRGFVVDGDDVRRWVGFLNDARLALGARLEITEDAHEWLEALPDDDPRAGLYQVYDWLTFLQESLVQRLLSAGA